VFQKSVPVLNNPTLPFLSRTVEPSDRRNRQCSCGCKRGEDVPEVNTQWVRCKAGPFSFPTLPLKVRSQGSRVTSDGGLVLVRELDERLGFGKLIEQYLADSREKNAQFSSLTCSAISL
jgi:hypothetical protein